MAVQVIDFSVVEVRNAPSGRRKLGALAPESPAETASLGSLALGEPLGVLSGGTGLVEVARGDLLVGIADNVMARIPLGAVNSLLTCRTDGGIPTWEPLRIRIADLAGIVPPDFFAHLVHNNGLTVTTTGGEPIWHNG